MIKKIATQPPKSTDQGQSQLPLSVDEGSGSGTLEKLREKAAHCQRCHLWETATQTVFGAGPADAGMMLVGEQPGDQEDLAGEPFVGPAGDVLDRALRDAGIDRAQVYVTNAVKHFKFEPRGKRRLHQKPDVSEITACRWWLEEERRLIKPRVIVALGATAARGVLSRTVRLMAERGKPIAEKWRDGAAHRASVLSAPPARSRKQARTLCGLRPRSETRRRLGGETADGAHSSGTSKCDLRNSGRKSSAIRCVRTAAPCYA